MSKFLYQPVRPFFINQKFGENKACVDNATGRVTIICDGNNPPQGYRSLYGSQGHLGMDLRSYHGQEVFSASRGVVSFIDTNPKSGLDVRVETGFQGQRYRHVYEHLLGYQTKVGCTVETGQLIGWADNTGYSSGDHLHFQFERWENNQWKPIDPLLYMENIFAPEILVINNKLASIRQKLGIILDNLANYLLSKKI